MADILRRMARVRLVRGDLSRFPADALVVPTELSFRNRGASGLVASALGARFGVDFATHAEWALGGMIPAGSARLLARHPGFPAGAPDVVCAACIGFHGIATADLVKTSFTEALRLVPRSARTIAAPALGLGFGRLPAAESARAMRAAVEAWARTSDAELVLILWEPGTYRTFLRAFDGLLASDARPFLSRDTEAPDLVLDALRETLVDRRAVLFVGSGLSRNASPPQPAWAGLFSDDWLPKKRQADLMDYAQIAADRHGKAALEMQFLSRLHADALPSLAHFQLLSLPWAAVFTTNYDTLVESTLESLRVKPIVITHDEQVATLDETDGVPVVKVHGGFCSRDCSVMPRDGRKHAEVGGHLAWDIVATRDDYDDFFERRPAIAAYLEAKLLTCPGVIAGYGISDPHLRQLFARIGGVAPLSARPRLLCVSSEASPIEDYWKRRGLRTLVVPLGADSSNYRDFVDAVATDAERARDASLVPETHLDERWDELTKGLEGAALLTLITSLVEAGCRPPPPVILARAFGSEEAEALARLHLSPERVSWLKRSLKSLKGP